MKISSAEYAKSHSSDSEARVLPEGDIKSLVHARNKSKKSSTPLEQGIAIAQEALESVPDVRSEVVEELKKRISSGEYNVSGEEIAEMMLRRLRADKVR